MNDGDALFRAILDDPDDDLPRLAYADWLEENGRQPRAQLIRRMCEAARLAAARDEDSRRRFAEATAEYSGLLARHEGEWVAELPKFDGVEWGLTGERTRFRRGFVHAITTRDWRTPVRAGAEALATTPVEWLRARLISAKGLSAWLRLGRFTRLDLSDNLLDDAAAAALFESPNLGRLRWLNVSGTRFSGAAVAALCDAPWFANVERFEARRLAWDEVVQVTLPHLPRLRHLDLGWSRLNPDSLGCVTAETFPNLGRLHLDHCELGDQGAGFLARSEATRTLRHLDLRRNGITDLGARALAASDHLDGLELLDLRGNRIAAAQDLLRDRFDHDGCRLLLDGEGNP